LRAAIALSNKGFPISFHSCICKKQLPLLDLTAKTFDFKLNYTTISKTIEFDYYHPLSHPIPIGGDMDVKMYYINNIKNDNILYFGMLEANAVFRGDYVVYDPQNQKSFKESGATANHLALVLNKKEALKLSTIES